ncbi:MAG TPA: hypothetical protein VGB13_01915 [Candidatus Krumholzibacteria bacterium]
MAVKDGGQKSFVDVPLMADEVIDACERYFEHKEAYKEYIGANKDLAKALPVVEEPTRFIVGERYFIEVTPQSVDGYDVKPRKQQRKRVRESHEA